MSDITGEVVLGSATTGGVGEDIQAHLTGDIPDIALPNSCND